MGIAQKLPDGVQEHLRLPRGAGLRQARDAPPAVRRLRHHHHPGRDRTVPASRPSRPRRTARTGWASMWASSSTSTSGRPTRSTSRCSPPTRTRRRSTRSSPRTIQHRRDRAADHLADRDPQRGRQPRVRYPGGRQPGPRQRPDGGDPDVTSCRTRYDLRQYSGDPAATPQAYRVLERGDMPPSRQKWWYCSRSMAFCDDRHRTR